MRWAWSYQPNSADRSAQVDRAAHIEPGEEAAHPEQARQDPRREADDAGELAVEMGVGDAQLVSDGSDGARRFLLEHRHGPSATLDAARSQARGSRAA